MVQKSRIDYLKELQNYWKQVWSHTNTHSSSRSVIQWTTRGLVSNFYTTKYYKKDSMSASIDRWIFHWDGSLHQTPKSKISNHVESSCIHIQHTHCATHRDDLRWLAAANAKLHSPGVPVAACLFLEHKEMPQNDPSTQLSAVKCCGHSSESLGPPAG